MITFAKVSNFLSQKATKAALLSILPGLGQLYNRRVDKALAFFIVDLANLALIALLFGAKPPFVQAEHFWLNLNAWRPGTAPFALIQLMLLSYVLYSQYDAYRDAQKNSELKEKPGLSLSHTTSASYVLHMCSMFAIGFFILAKICPECRPLDNPQITLSFELQSPQDEAEKMQGIDGKIGIESNKDESAHLKDRPRDNEIQGASPSAEMSSSMLESSTADASADQISALTSKQIISPDSKQSPRDVSSKGESTKAKLTTKLAVEEAKLADSTPNSLSGKSLPEKIDQADEVLLPLQNENKNSRTKLIAQLPESAAAASGMASKLDETNSQISSVPAPAVESGQNGKTNDSGTAAQVEAVQGPQNISYETRIPARPARAAMALVSPMMSAGLMSPQVQIVQGVSTAGFSVVRNNGVMVRNFTGAAAPISSSPSPALSPSLAQDSGPSMLGFMDSEFSDNADIRSTWAEMSGNISRSVKAHPLQGEGVAVSTFKLNRSGKIVNVDISSEQNDLSTSLSNTLSQLPSCSISAKQVDQMYFQVKAMKDGQSTFISVEINSKPTAVTSETVSDFKYQANLQQYLKGIKKEVYSKWQAPVKEGLKPVMVGFKVSTEGRITNQHIVQSSGDPKIDKAAITAALSVTNWSQPPAGTSEDMDVCLVLQKCKNCDGELKKAQAQTQPGKPSGVRWGAESPLVRDSQVENSIPEINNSGF